MQAKKYPSKVSMFIRSLIFATFVPFFTAIYSVVCLIVVPLPVRYSYPVVVFWTKIIIWFLKVTCHINYEVYGLENIPNNRNGIVMSKHQSTWETYFLPQFFKQAAIILKRELFWVPFFGWGMLAAKPIAINRKDKTSAMSQIIAKGRACLQAGRWVLLFPEGTRIPYGQVGRYHLGGARLAVETGYPVLPVAHNAGKFWPRRKFMKIPGTVKVYFGPLIEPAGKTPEEITALTKDWIESTIQQMEKG